MKTKIISSLILLVISTFVFVASCSKSEDEEFSAGTSAALLSLLRLVPKMKMVVLLLLRRLQRFRRQ